MLGRMASSQCKLTPMQSGRVALIAMILLLLSWTRLGFAFLGSPAHSFPPGLQRCGVQTWPAFSPVSRRASFHPRRRRNSSVSLTAKSQGKKRLTAFMAFLTGWADVALVVRYNTFATMMTGNTIRMAQAFGEQRFRDVGYYISVIASYLLGLVVFRKTNLSLKERSMSACALVVTTLFVASDCIHCSYGGARWIPVMLLASAFGIVNSVGSEVAGTITFTTTGHLTKLTNQIVDRLSRTAGRKKLTPTDRVAAIQNAIVILGFFGGALWACLLRSFKVLKFEFAVMGCLYGILFLWQDMESLGGAWWLRTDGEMCDLDDDGSLCHLDDNDDHHNNDWFANEVEADSDE